MNKKRTKLAYICPWFSEEFGGPLYNLLNELSKHINVVCMCSRQKYIQYFKRNEKYENKVEVINPNFKIHRFEAIAPRDVVIPFGLLKILDEEKPDIIQSDEYFRFTTIQAAKYARKNKIPLIINSRMRYRSGVARNGFLRLMTLFARNAVKEAKHIVAIGEIAKKEFLRWFPNTENKIEVIPTGLYPNKFKGIGPKQAEKFRIKYGIPLNKKIILDIARIYPVKRIDLLVRAFALVKQKVKDVALVVVGPAIEEEKQRILALVGELGLKVNVDVFFTGPIENKNIGLAYAAADVFANTSETEGICFSFLEAMSFKIPIVAFDVGGNPDVVKNGENGYLVPFGNIKSFANSLIDILADSKLKAKLGSNCREKILGDFNLSTIVKRLVYLML